LAQLQARSRKSHKQGMQSKQLLVAFALFVFCLAEGIANAVYKRKTP
jgi:hypothetical protein